MIMIYKLTSIPDISLSKYQNMSVGGIEGLKEYADDFLRQWQKVSAIYDIEINYIVRFVPESKKGNRLGCYVVFKYEDERLSGYISNLMKSSQLTDLYGIVYLEENPFECSTFKEKFVLKKCERKRKYEVGNDDKIDLFYVETWEANKNSRLIDLYNTMQTFNTEIVYRVVLTGSDAYEDIFSSLEKPIEYLKNRSLNGEQNAIKLSDNTKWVNNKNAFSNEILRTYEQFLKSVSNAPCFKGNVIVYSNDDILGNMIFSSVCGECIEKGNWENIVLKNGPFNVLDDYEEFCDIMPRTLKYWPTYYTLDEVKSFFRPPMLYDAENIEMRKETDPLQIEGNLYLGKNTQEISIPLNILKKHAFVCGVPGAGKTNTMLHICYSLWKNCNVPFLVLEPAKKEYRALSQTDIDDLIIFSPSSGSRFPMAINPFEFAMGLSLSEHIQNLMNVFEGAFPLTPPLPALLDRAIEGVYNDHGWDADDINEGNKEYPTISELYDRLEFELKNTDYDGEVRGNMKSALEMRIGGLLRRDLGNVFDVKISSLKPEELIQHPIIIEMESMGTGPSNFMTLMICTLIREVLKADPKGNDNRSVRHVIFIEEAHNLIANATGEMVTGDANPKVAATNYIVKMLAEVRALREGIIIADQLPTVMAAEVLKNTGLKIVHRLTAGDDRAVIGEMMSANGMQIESIATYMPGDALISYEGLMRPFKMKIAEFNLKDAPATEKLYELMSIRDLQRHISKETFAIRLQKNKQNWMKEWRIAVVVFEQLQNDCSKIDMIESINEYEILVNTIVKDQIGVEKCINKLKKLVKKYKNTLDLAMEVDHEDNEFYRHMNESIQKLIKNAQIVLQKDRRNVK